jgi:hypothetical protein
MVELCLRERGTRVQIGDRQFVHAGGTEYKAFKLILLYVIGAELIWNDTLMKKVGAGVIP